MIAPKARNTLAQRSWLDARTANDGRTDRERLVVHHRWSTPAGPVGLFVEPNDVCLVWAKIWSSALGWKPIRRHSTVIPCRILGGKGLVGDVLTMLLPTFCPGQMPFQLSTFKDCPVADECWRSLCAKTRLFGPIDELHNSNVRILLLGFSLFFFERQVGFELNRILILSSARTTSAGRSERRAPGRATACLRARSGSPGDGGREVGG